MRRLFWLTLGAGLGAWATLRVQRFARQFGPRGVAGRAVGLGAQLRAFAADVRIQMRQREAELRRTLDGPPPAGVAALPAARRRTIEGIEGPDGPGRHDVRTTHHITPDDTDKDGH